MFKGCVSKDKAFYDFCKEHDLAPSSMELIIHSWWRTHDDGSMPDKDFIDKAKYGERTEMSDNDIFYAMSDRFFAININNDPTPNGYFDSKEFTDRKEAEDYYRELKRMFPIKAIGSYTNSEGKIIITLAKPLITDKLKYRDYQVPAVGSKIIFPETGETYTVKNVSRASINILDIETEEREGTLRFFRNNDNPNKFEVRPKGRSDNPNPSYIEVEIEGPTQSIYAEFEDNKVDISSFVNHSGGAIGSDSYWGEIGEKYGVTSRHYEGLTTHTPKGNVKISQEDSIEGQQKVTKAAHQMGRLNPNYGVKDERLIRNWSQVKYSDSIFAIGHLIEAGERIYPDREGDTRTATIKQVAGGTGYAVQMAINEGKPVYVFDQNTKKWYTYNNGIWIETNTPTLTRNFAGIGTRNINEAGKKAIEEVYEKTLTSTSIASKRTIQSTPPTINIYAGTGENAELSNFADRPFTLDNTIIVNIEGVGPVTILDSEESFDSVEKAFQSAKIGFAYDGTSEAITDEDADSFKKRIQNASTSGEAKRIGRQIPMSQTALRDWEAHKEEVMKALMKASFEQNPEALKKLLATGDAVLTHTQGTDGWDKLFPKVLMEVREELRGQEDYLEAIAPIKNDIRKIDSILRTDKKYFNNINNVIDYIESLSKYNPRLGQLGKFLKKKVQDRTSLTKEEYDAMKSLLLDIKDKLIRVYEAIEDIRKKENNFQKGADKAALIKERVLKILGGEHDPNAQAEFDATIATATAGIALETALKGVNPVFNEEEQAQIKEALKSTPDGRLRVMSVSRQTDPVFFSKEIVKFLEENSKKPLTDPTRVNVIEVWTKHDGEPIQDILEACKKYKVAPMVSFSITGLGNTALEQGVMKYQDLLDRIEKLVKAGALNPATTTIRIDPILVGETKLEDIKAIVEKAKAIGIKKFVTSLVQSYGYSDGTAKDRKVTSGINEALAKEGRTYDWDKYYGRDFRGQINFKPKKEYIEEIGNFLVELNKDPDIEIETCAFPVKGLKNSACLDPLIIERVTGVDVTSSDGKYKRDTSRKDCMCYGAHSDMFRFNEKKCFSSCAYCYAAHSGDNSLNYYNADGTIKDNPYTRVRLNQQQEQQQEMEKKEQELKAKDQEFIDSNVVLNESINKLMTSKVITAAEVNDIAMQIGNQISDEITDILNGKQETLERYKKQLEGIDVTKASRIEIARAIGIKNLIESCKNIFLNAQTTAGLSFREAMQLALINDNWDAMLQFADPTFIESEGFSLLGNGEIIEDTDSQSDDINGTKDNEQLQEETGDSRENWQIEARTRSFMKNASALVKSVLRGCYLLDENGETQTTKFGIKARVELHDAVSSIIRWTQGAQDIDEMLDALNAKVESNPWIKQVIEKLEDRESGKWADFQSQFFTAVCLREQLYSVVKARRDKNTGKITYVSIPVNKFPALKNAYSSVENQFKIGEHPMFTSKGVNESALLQLEDAYKTLVEESEKANPDKKTIDRMLLFAYHSLGYYAEEKDIAEVTKDKNSTHEILRNLESIIASLKDHKEDENYRPFAYDKDRDSGTLYNSLRGMLRPLTERLEDISVSSFYEGGKMYQTYTIPSYMTNLMAKFHQKDEAKFEKFIKEQYGSSEWFYDKKEDEWYLPWLDKIVNNKEARNVFEHKVQLAFDKKAYMSDMGDLQYVMSIMSEYFNFEVKKGATEAPAWFRVPMLSNKSSSEFIKFYKQVGTRYKSNIVLGMVDIMLQEIARIRTVNTRNLNEGDRGYIKNWDERGKHFNLLTFLDKYMEEKSEFGNLLRKATSKEGLTEEKENIKLIKKAKEIIMGEMQEKANKILAQYEKDGIIDAASSIENIGNSKEEIRDNIENFIWNDTFAAMNILELTVTDPAYYKDAVDLQKRFAQIHAPGTRPNVKATDYGDPKTGRKPAPVADKWSRTIVIKDFKKLTSNIIENLEIVFDRKIKESEGATKEMYISMKDRIIKAFKDINLTDAQAYNSPTSYRKKAILFGRWSREKEDIYQRLMKGDKPNITDLEKAFGEVLKPFVYTQTVESVGKEGSPIQNIPVPFQNKNSEYLLIMADAILKGENTGKPNLLRAIYQVMEDSAKANPTRGIDTVQFDSAIKSGLHDAISLKEFADKENGEFLAKEHILNSIYKRDASGKRTTEYSESVRPIDWMDYGIQQEVPEHFKNHEQAHGSQIRAITPSELSLDAVFTVEGRQLKAKEFAKEYEETIAQNIKESLELLEKKFNIKGNRKERNIALAKILQEELNSSSRYGLDLKQACLLNADGEFNIALGDPIQSKRIEQLINSVIKNNVNKQEIAGGPVVQVSNFGTSKSLNIRFKDKSDPSGKTLLMTEEEWNNSSNKKEKTFKEYRDNNQGGIAYFECYAPIYLDEEFFNRFADENGNIDISLIEKLDPDLLKMVGYRIPTEDKYSCAPLKIVGFLPRLAGEGIMLPAEITSISGSDFDVDKMYVMRKEFRFVENRDKIHKELFESLIKSQDHALKYETKRALHELIDQFLDNPYNKEGLVNQKVAEGYISMTENAYNTLLEAYEKARKKAENTKIIWPKQGRAYRNNKIVDMTYEVLTHEDSVDKILNPGGFEPQKELGYMVADIKGANSVEQNLTFIDTHVQFYKQNSAAASLIGTFAVHKVAHALLERDPLYINFRPASGLKVPMTLGNTVLDGWVEIDPTRDSEQALIGKTLGSLVASAADAAKDPVLNFMNINKDTANILTTAIRLGVPFRHAALLLSQKCMDEILHTLSQERLKGEAASLQGVIEERLKKLKKEAGMEEDGADSVLLSEGLAEWQLQTGLRGADKKHEIKVLSYVNALLNLNKELKGVTLATRFNSISNATGPLIVDNLIMEEKMKDFSKHIRIYDEKTEEYKKLENGILDVFALHPILQEFSKGYNMARIIMRDMPLYKESFLYILDAFENLGVESIISNRDNLSKFADYYLSYILVANDVINPGDCSYYINDFPRDFLFREKCKEKYRGNPFIDAIKLTIDSNTGLSSLSIDITGLNNRQKSILMSGFIDLLSKDKEMAIKLFNYNFFRGGLGFTPKTFMSLTPLLLKQSIKGYNESYLNSPTIDPKFIIDLFIRNNWSKSEFVKYFPEYHVELTEDGPILVPNYSMSENGDITVSDESLYNRYKKQGYIRFKLKGEDKLYKRTAVYKEIKTLTYTEVKPLGGNGAYLEFTDTPIKIKDNLELLDEDTSGNGVRKGDKQGPDDTHDDPYNPPTPELTLSHVLSAFESALKSRDKAHEKLTEFKNKTKEEQKNLEPKIKELLRKEFTKLNIPFNEDELNKIYKKMC